MRHVVVGTAGHIDHGKTSLVKALTGTDTDRLPEEKARGITIDLGFAFLEEPGGLVIEIVDVPGHERFVRNMLAGAGGIDLALLVVRSEERRVGKGCGAWLPGGVYRESLAVMVLSWSFALEWLL